MKIKDLYLRDLQNKIEQTILCRYKEEEEISYDLFVKILVERLMIHKKMRSNLYFIGNGGSSAIASHMTADFMKNGGMNTYSLYDNAVTTCMGNDYGYEYVFSKPLEFLTKKDDLLVAISSSGNSANIINAIRIAREKGAEIFTFTGFKPDNQVKQLGDYNVYVPSDRYGIVESIHNIILQELVDMIMEQDGVTI